MGPVRRGGGQGDGRGELRGRGAPAGEAAPWGIGPRQSAELPPRAHRVEIEPARLLREGARVLPAPPSGGRERRGGAGVPTRGPPRRRQVAGRGSSGKARPAGVS